jgi:outer membrane lipoprotein SlyB
MQSTLFKTIAILSATVVTAGSAEAANMVSVAYGTITGVNQQEKDTSGGKAGGAVLGGLVGLYSGKGKSTSNKALRSLGGAAVGSAAGGTMARGTEMVYTVSLVDGGTVRIVMDSGNFHRSDCVAVERGGASANMRRVSEEFCTHNAAVPQQHKAEHQKEANECVQAKQQLLDAQTEDAIKAAHMKMNILCQD